MLAKRKNTPRSPASWSQICSVCLDQLVPPWTLEGLSLLWSSSPASGQPLLPGHGFLRPRELTPRESARLFSHYLEPQIPCPGAPEPTGPACPSPQGLSMKGEPGFQGAKGNPGTAVCGGLGRAWIEGLRCPRGRCKALMMVQDGANETRYGLSATSSMSPCVRCPHYHLIFQAITKVHISR